MLAPSPPTASTDPQPAASRGGHPLPWVVLPVPPTTDLVWIPIKRLPATGRTLSPADITGYLAGLADTQGVGSWAELPPAALGAFVRHMRSFTETRLCLDPRAAYPQLLPALKARWPQAVPWSALLNAFLLSGPSPRVPKGEPGNRTYHQQAFRRWWAHVAATQTWDQAFARLAADAPLVPRLLGMALTTLPRTPALADWIRGDVTTRWRALDAVLRTPQAVPAPGVRETWVWAAAHWPEALHGELLADLQTAQATRAARAETSHLAFRLVATGPNDSYTMLRCAAMAATPVPAHRAARDAVAQALEQLDASWTSREPDVVPPRYAGAWNLLRQWPDPVWERLARLAQLHPDPRRLRDLWRHRDLTAEQALQLLATRDSAAVRRALADNRALLGRSPELRAALAQQGQDRRVWQRLHETAQTPDEAARAITVLVQCGTPGIRLAGRLFASDTRWGPTALALPSAVFKTFLLSKDRAVRELAMRHLGDAAVRVTADPLPAKPPRLSTARAS